MHSIKGPIFTGLFPPQQSDISLNYKDIDWIVNHDLTVVADRVLDCTPTEDLTFNLTINVSVFYREPIISGQSATVNKGFSRAVVHLASALCYYSGDMYVIQSA